MLKRILLTTDAVGGVWQYSMELSRGLVGQGIDLVLVVLGPPPSSAQLQEVAQIRGAQLVVTALQLDWLASTPAEIEFAASFLADLACQADADTVQLHAPALVGHALWPVPVVAVVHSCVATWWDAVRHGPLPSALAWRAAATQFGIARADAVVAPSASFAAALGSRYGIARPIEVILNGKMAIDAKTERRQQALAVGRLWDEGKNFASLDDAAGKLRWPVFAAGAIAGPHGAGIKCDHLRKLGSLEAEALARQYAEASVFVSLSQYEPFGLAVLEAAQAACALVLADIPTFRELWDGAALFVPGDAPDQIAGAIERLLLHPAVCACYGMRASRRAALFTVQRMTNATLAVHERLRHPMQTAA